jgi:hypothetical protein
MREIKEKQIKKYWFRKLIWLCILFMFLGPEIFAADPNPTWYVDARVINHGQCNPYDYYAAKDPTIVCSGDKYHVFYTGANQSGGWQMLYTSASTIDGLKNASRTYMSRIGESYFCAPEVFYFEPDGLWYLVYQDGTYGAAYSTTTNIGDPNSWNGPKSFGISGNMGWDYFVICDDTYCYMYNSPDNSDHNIYMRRTDIGNFPSGWGSPSVAVSDTFEGANIYKCLSDGKYYMTVEDMKDGRYYELWSSSGAGGPWSKVAEKWAWRGNISYNADQWTTNVSHGEIIRAGTNQKLEINDIDRVDFLIQGTTNTSGDYHNIIWDLGFIHNYTGQVTPDPTTPPEDTPTPDPVETPGPTGTPNQDPIFSGGPYSLNGTSDYVDLPDGITSDLHDFSIACWVKLNSLDTWSRIFDFGGDTNVFMMLTPASGNTGYPYFCITTSGNDGEQGINGTDALPTGSWQHLAVTRSGNTGTLYINTQEVGRNTGITLHPADMGNTTNNYIGRSQWSQDPYLNGEVDEFVVYNRALSASEVSALGSTPPGGGTGTLGDANGDGAINIVDALLIAQEYVGLNPSGFIAANADTNCDGSINIVDALLVAQYYVGLIQSFC